MKSSTLMSSRPPDGALSHYPTLPPIGVPPRKAAGRGGAERNRGSAMQWPINRTYLLGSLCAVIPPTP
eukprot:2250359-Prymnesium_polylepis.1